MSGPKAVSVSGAESLAILCAPFIIGAVAVKGAVVLAQKATQLAMRKIHLAQYSRLCGNLDELRTQLKDLGIVKEIAWKTPDKLTDSDDLSVRIRDAELIINLFKEEIQEQIFNIQKRHRELVERINMIENEREKLKILLTAVDANALPKSDKARIEAEVAEILKQDLTARIPALTLDEKGIQNMGKSEAWCNETISLFLNTKQSIEQIINDAYIKNTMQRLSVHQEPSTLLADFMKARKTKDFNQDDKIIGKLDAMLAKVVLLRDTASWKSLMQRAVDIRKESDPYIRRVQYESLVLECDRQISLLKEYESWRSALETLIDSATPLMDHKIVSDIVRELEALLRSGRIVDLKDIRKRLESASKKARENNGREYRRLAVIESLRALGYEIGENQMSMALIDAGKIYIQKPSQRDYAVEVVTNNDFSTLQTAVVRFANAEDATQQQRLRDMEEEGKWCEDHARLLSDMAAKGIDSQFKFRIRAGEARVRVVTDADHIERRQKERSVPIQKRQLNPKR